uniref:Pathogenesis-related transcriptional factor and ERF protein n=1 Tax=uncultured marine virus TaxID=186617 RepID=A0A0F7L5J5_9VIRU|nr:pathogenesis-related transcriptional factor and ERF protein [uncultured marine virus]
MNITKEQIMRRLKYCESTGVFTWINGRRPGIEAGSTMTSKGKTYIRIKIDKFSYFAHRLAFLYVTGSMPINEVDHINGDGTDNSWSNLRDVNRNQNAQNQKLFSSNKSGVTGVSCVSSRGKWRATIKCNGVSKYLGEFNDKFDAICARKSADRFFEFHPNHGESRS